MKILVVGINGFGMRHLSAIKNMDIYVMERKENVIAEAKSRYDIKRVFNDYNEALNSDADIVDLVVPHNLHRDLAIKAMEHKKHVLVEKPIATTLDDGKAMIDVSRKNRVKFMVAEQYFFDPYATEARRLIQNNAIGDVKTVIVRDQRFFDHGGWRLNRESMGGGALIDGGIHFIDTLLNFAGDYSDVRSIINHGGTDLEGEDNINALFKFKNGAAGLFFYSWAYRFSPRLPAFEIIGENGSMYEDSSSKISWDSGIRTAYGGLIMNGKKVDVRPYDIFEKEISSFAESIENDNDVPFSPELELRDLKAVLDIYKNANF
ncbi:Gfo/Idh/MocA family protein [Picrophilus oshimae]|uniref:Predicted dehydrogenase n=1 Tax=Picrophilus torridus (strain ATCC 700027 / DSM 9790 / JCM 10055 / NBRC 100828 / KAW 2/3) TaxID=1122961 RepID=A0A8G2L7R7_PICTO|nr:Gfo/Idh/MocA family oxidoreductase [Picrophilus oshimae]SMD30584.1 Predicted dehydrogenase [Picrophilus oshimae DSM 9789]